MPEAIFRFAESLRDLLRARTVEELEQRWEALTPEDVGWEALECAWRRDAVRWERALKEVDGLLLRLLDHVPALAGNTTPTPTPTPPPAPAAIHARTFREPALERLQHGAAAALVAQRFGPAGLHTVVDDEEAPVARRYYAFLALAERHPPAAWGLFARYLTPDAHHAFLGVAAEAARYYCEHEPAPRLLDLFETTRGDQHLRTFLSPRILESLYVLKDRRTLPFFRGLLTAGHTDPDPEYCEVIRALVMVRRFTGRVEPNAKYPDSVSESVRRVLDQAAERFEQTRDVLRPVLVI